LGKRRTKSSSGSLPCDDGIPSNVIDLDTHRWRRARFLTHSLFYINEDGAWWNVLSSFPMLRVENVQDEETLRSRLLSSQPDLILIDSQIRWADLVELTSHLHHLVQVPIVMLCHAPPNAKTSRLLKQAYAVGLHDAVFAPLEREDLFESLEVLLKFRRQQCLPTGPA
jgi:CheY-like chemotaxis protein